MQKKRIVVGITAIVVLALLFAGVGYATFSGNARTYNQGDEQTLAYMTVTPDSFDAIFTDDKTHKTVFDTYVYNNSGKKTAYGFDGGETTSPTTVTTTSGIYTAVALNSTPLTLTVDNQTGDSITKLNVAINASNTAGAIGSTDFVYIFELQIGSEDPVYIEFDGTSVLEDVVIEPNDSIADNTTKAIKVTVYIGYTPNVYVPDTYIGPAAANSAPGFTKPYRQTANAPEDLGTTAFGILVTDATPSA